MNRLRSWAPGVVPLTIGLVALWYFHGIVAAQDALSTWIVGRYLGVMLLAGLWGLSALCGGFFVSEKLKLGALPLRERLVFSFALGLVAWGCSSSRWACSACWARRCSSRCRSSSSAWAACRC